MPPLVTDINLSVDDKFLYVSCWGMGEALAGGPQMVEVSRGGKRIYLTNSLYGSWDDQFYPDGVGSWFAKIDTDPAAGGGCTRSGWAAATRPRTPTATRRDNGSPGRPRPG